MLLWFSRLSPFVSVLPILIFKLFSTERSQLHVVHFESWYHLTCRKHQSVLPVCVCVGVQLSHSALGNVMSPLCPEEGNRDLWLELQTLILLQAHR